MFSIRSYSSEEEFDIAKFMQFDTDVYDVINCQMLTKLKDLPVSKYYKVNEGFREIDLISSHVYGDPFFAYYIQYFNDISEDTLPEDTVLKLFSIEDLNNLYYDLLSQENS